MSNPTPASTEVRTDGGNGTSASGSEQVVGYRHVRRRSGRSTRRWLVVGVVVIGLVGLIRGLFWAAAFPVPTQDEGSQLSTIESIAHGHFPIEGKANESSDILRLFKDAPPIPGTDWRSTTVTPTPSDPRWQLTGKNYEADQPPLYYVVMVPAFWIGHALGGITGALFAVRLFTLLLSLLALPLLAWLARLVFPRHLVVALLAPAALVGLQMFPSTAAVVDNDSLTAVLGLGCLVALAQGRRRLTWPAAVSFGALAALAMLTKGTTLALLPLLGLGIVDLIYLYRARLGQLARWMAAAVGAAAVLFVPWVAWNENRYGALTGSKAHTALTAPTTGYLPFSLHSLDGALHHVWHAAFAAPQLPNSRYRDVWIVAAAILVLGGLTATALRREWRELCVAGAVTASLPAGALVLVVATLQQTHANAEARYLDILLPMFCLMFAWGAVAVFRAHAGTIVLVGFVAAAGILEARPIQRYVSSNYETALYGTAAPVIEQTYATTITTAPSITITPPCPVRYVSVHLNQYLPRATIDGAVPSDVPAPVGWNTYQLDSPRATRFTIDLVPPAQFYTAEGRHTPGVQLAGSQLDPLVRVYCDVAHPAQARFAQTYKPNHPFPMTWTVLYRAPQAIAGGMILLAGGVTLGVAWDARRRWSRRS